MVTKRGSRFLGRITRALLTECTHRAPQRENPGRARENRHSRKLLDVPISNLALSRDRPTDARSKRPLPLATDQQALGSTAFLSLALNTTNWWRRRELNPRPKQSPPGLLRAYPGF